MWARRSHTLVPLTKITSSTVKFKRTKIWKDAFDKIKRIAAHDNLLTHIDFNKELKIHTYANNFQLVLVIRQKGEPISFYGRKLTDTQKRFTLTERELLNTVKNLKVFITILLGHRLIIHPDHLKLTC